MSDETKNAISVESMSNETKYPIFVKPTSDETKNATSVDFSSADSGIFWSVKDCPIPSGRHYRWAEDKIRIALDDLGYDGYLAPARRYDGKDKDIVHQLLIDMINFALSRYPKHINLMVLSKKMSEDSEFSRVLRALRLRGCNVLLVPPPDSPSENMFETPDYIKKYTQLLDGGDPRIKRSERSDDSDSDSDK